MFLNQKLLGFSLFYVDIGMRNITLKGGRQLTFHTELG